jgi:RecB family endonuclease NucS
MPNYEALTHFLNQREEPDVTLTFDELDSIVGGLPNSAKQYPAWWANNVNSQPHSRAWLNAHRRGKPDFRNKLATFTRLSADAEAVFEQPAAEVSEQLTTYVESTLSLERDLEDHLIANLGSLEAGLKYVDRQVTIAVGRVDILAKDSSGRTVIIELKVGEARDAAVAQVAKYIGWYTRSEGATPRAILVAAEFPDTVKYAASAIPGLRLASYRIAFSFSSADLE